MFVKQLQGSIQQPHAFDPAKFEAQMLAYEGAFPNTTLSFPSVPSGDALAMAHKLRAKYSGIDWSSLSDRPSSPSLPPRPFVRNAARWNK